MLGLDAVHHELMLFIFVHVELDLQLLVRLCQLSDGVGVLVVYFFEVGERFYCFQALEGIGKLQLLYFLVEPRDGFL